MQTRRKPVFHERERERERDTQRWTEKYILLANMRPFWKTLSIIVWVLWVWSWDGTAPSQSLLRPLDHFSKPPKKMFNSIRRSFASLSIGWKHWRCIHTNICEIIRSFKLLSLRNCLTFPADVVLMIVCGAAAFSQGSSLLPADCSPRPTRDCPLYATNVTGVTVRKEGIDVTAAAFGNMSLIKKSRILKIDIGSLSENELENK